MVEREWNISAEPTKCGKQCANELGEDGRREEPLLTGSDSEDSKLTCGNIYTF